MSTLPRILLTGAIVVVAITVVLYKYRDYFANPWTRDGMVRAQVVQITPRVSGPIVELLVEDNQRVTAGDLLFRIDPRTFKAGLDQARANLDQTRDQLRALDQEIKSAQALVEQATSEIKKAESAIESSQAEDVRTKTDLERARVLLAQGDVSRRRYDQAQADYAVARANLETALSSLTEARSRQLQLEAELERAKADRGAAGEENAQLRSAKSAVETASLNLEFTEVRAPVDGYVTNLNLRLGDQAVANQAALALVDVNSYWVHGFFRETLIGNIREGDRAIVTLMSYPDTPLEGRVHSKGKGIAQEDGSTGFDLLPQINPTFEWIRLAQRVPVRVHLVDVPDHIELVVGTTASVLVMTGTAGSEGAAAVPPVPKALQ